MSKLLSIYAELQQVSFLGAVTDIRESPGVGRKPSTGGAPTNEKHGEMETEGEHLIHICREIRRNFVTIKQEQNTMQKEFGKKKAT